MARFPEQKKARVKSESALNEIKQQISLVEESINCMRHLENNGVPCKSFCCCCCCTDCVCINQCSLLTDQSCLFFFSCSFFFFKQGSETAAIVPVAWRTEFMKYCEKLIKWRKERATAIEQRLKTRHQHNESRSSSSQNTGKSTNECVGPSYNTIEDGLPTKTKKLKGAICGHLTCPHGKLEAGGKKIFWVSRTVYNTLQKHFHSTGGSGGSGGSSSSAVPIVIEDEGGGKQEPLQDPVFLGEKLQHVCEECREGKQDSKKEKQAKKSKHKQQLLEEDEQGKLYNSKLQLCKNAIRCSSLVVGGGGTRMHCSPSFFHFFFFPQPQYTRKRNHTCKNQKTNNLPSLPNNL